MDTWNKYSVCSSSVQNIAHESAHNFFYSVHVTRVSPESQMNPGMGLTADDFLVVLDDIVAFAFDSLGFLEDDVVVADDFLVLLLLCVAVTAADC